jgi:hypothetical protein
MAATLQLPANPDATSGMVSPFRPVLPVRVEGHGLGV